MQSIWAGFAKNPSSGPAGPGWSSVGESADQDLFVFGARGGNSGTSIPSNEVDGPCKLLDLGLWLFGLA